MDSIIHFDPANLERFWKFIAERQKIWHRRFVQEDSRPWTQDPILQKNKFTNIYRELDPGTKFVRLNVLQKDEPRPDRVFNVMIYRLICSIPTYSKLGFQLLDEFDQDYFESQLKKISDYSPTLFGNAYMISPYFSMGSRIKYVNVARLFGKIQQNFDKFFFELDSATSFQDAFKVVNGQYGFGPFLAYQVMVDLTYLIGVDQDPGILPHSQNEWARLGPGAQRGFKRLVQRGKFVDPLQGLRWLWSHQHEKMHELGLDFPYLRDAHGQDIAISLANMQNCLCEFHKYMSIGDGTGKAQRLYVPSNQKVR